ncbi:predicted protein [Micromonas commoda]|uniref:U-box domain-containing protein n=1 Tax=Micromonas commoda (strain RCC299 / NOUM17 / CCMP2709) TaxID=296587 RepID=C1E9B5_MICCC|nr:predicted protein [Micromonas commoda]ACO64652.1 predicted protein [Micromonas commoda]|eukprot:XP_002503394.1 predicted protein [Micromonas commoda]
MPRSKRPRLSAAPQHTAGNASSEDAGDVPVPVPPGNLLCPISLCMYRDPVVVVESGHTYDRSQIMQHFARRQTDPKTNRRLHSTMVVTNWAMRDTVQEWLDRHPGYTPDEWGSRELLPVQGEAPVETADPGNRDALMLQMWRELCPELRAIWGEGDDPSEQWRGVTMENGRVVKLELKDVGLTGAVQACIGWFTSLRVLYLNNNKLTSVPAEIGQLTSLEELHLHENQLTSVPAEIGQLTSLTSLDLSNDQLTSVPAEIGQLTSLWQLQLHCNRLTSVPASIGRLTSLTSLDLSNDQLTSVPAEIGQLTSLRKLNLTNHRLSILPRAIGVLAVNGCEVFLHH